jgi:hypothetical protein
MGKSFTLKFKECVDTYPLPPGDLSFLPLCHTTDWGSFDKISENGIECKPCDQYKDENLAYFFYGKASYYLKGNNKPVITSEPPITLIYDLENISENIHRILPFDSGGYLRYKIRGGFTKEDFTYCQPSDEIARRMIRILYETNRGYAKIKLSKTIDTKMQNLCRPLREIIRLHNLAGGTADYGAHAFTFEIQYKDTVIPFVPKIVLLPFTYFDDEVKDEIEKMYTDEGIDIQYYNDDETFVEGGDCYTNMKLKVKELLAGY